MSPNPREAIESLKALVASCTGNEVDVASPQSQHVLITSLQDALERNERELQANVNVLACMLVNYAPIIEELLKQQAYISQRLVEAKAAEQQYKVRTEKLMQQLKADGRPTVPTDKRPPFSTKHKAG